MRDSEVYRIVTGLENAIRQLRKDTAGDLNSIQQGITLVVRVLKNKKLIEDSDIGVARDQLMREQLIGDFAHHCVQDYREYVKNQYGKPLTECSTVSIEKFESWSEAWYEKNKLQDRADMFGKKDSLFKREFLEVAQKVWIALEKQEQEQLKKIEEKPKA